MNTHFLRHSAIALLFGVLPTLSAAAPEPDEVQIGPVEYQQSVNGVSVVVSATTYAKVVTVDNKIYLKARIVGDLVDLQRKIGAIVDTFDLPRDNCRSYSPNNPVVSIPRKELLFRDGAAIFSLGANVVMWQCLENPVPNTKVEWQVKDIGFGIKTKVPVVISWPGSPIKTILVRQPFDADLPVTLVKNNDHAVGLQFSKPDIELGGQYAFITKGVLKIAGVDINQKAYDALQKAIDPEKLRLTIPEELSKFNPAVESARFIDLNGHLSAEISVSALVPAAVMTDLIKELLNKTRT
jgi:hypothetical protein